MAVRLTEQPSLYDHLEKKSVAELLRDINTEDKKVPLAIEAVLPDIERLVNAIEAQIRAGGRFFWLGAGTGGNLEHYLRRKVEPGNLAGRAGRRQREPGPGPGRGRG